MSATAPSKRDLYRYTKYGKRGRDAVKLANLRVPRANVIEAQAVGSGSVKLLLRQGYSNSLVTSVVAEFSLDGSTGWTACTVSAYVVGDRTITLTGVAVGLKYFRFRGVNAAGAGTNSNIVSVTVT